MREKEDFRNTLERINDRYPNKEMLNVSEVAAFIGIHRTTVSSSWEKYFIKIGHSKYMSKATLARLICP